jgi:hypothetical protein
VQSRFWHKCDGRSFESSSFNGLLNLPINSQISIISIKAVIKCVAILIALAFPVNNIAD